MQIPERGLTTGVRHSGQKGAFAGQRGMQKRRGGFGEPFAVILL